MKSYTTYGGMILIFAISVAYLWDIVFGPGSSNENTSLFFSVVALMAFVVAFSLNMVLQRNLVSYHIALLLVQTVAALLTSFDLVFLVAAQAPLVLPARHALYWIFFQILLVLPIDFHLFLRDYQLDLRQPDTIEILTLVMVDAVWQAFAFMVGWLLMAALRQNLLISSLNKRLFIAQSRLADRSRAEERLSISRELHDSLGHHLVALSVNLELASRLSTPASTEPIAAARELTDMLLRELRDVVAVLRREQLDLRSLLEGIAEEAPEVVLIWHLEQSVKGELAHTLYRCAQEAITNARKHASAQRVEIVLSANVKEIVLCVTDDGDGTDLILPGFGLRGIQERVVRLGGEVKTVSGPEGGFRLEVRLPYYP